MTLILHSHVLKNVGQAGFGGKGGKGTYLNGLNSFLSVLLNWNKAALEALYDDTYGIGVTMDTLPI